MKKTVHVLLAEDNDLLSTHLSIILEKFGVICNVVRSVSQAKNAINSMVAQSQTYSLAIVDLHLEPDSEWQGSHGNSRDFVDWLRGQNIALPIIGYSTDFDDCTLEQCLAMGLDDRLKKPTSRASVQALLSKQGLLGICAVESEPARQDMR